MTKKPLIARASFANTALTEDQIARVSGGDGSSGSRMVGCGGNSKFTVEPTWSNDRPDSTGHCGD